MRAIRSLAMTRQPPMTIKNWIDVRDGDEIRPMRHWESPDRVSANSDDMTKVDNRIDLRVNRRFMKPEEHRTLPHLAVSVAGPARMKPAGHATKDI